MRPLTTAHSTEDGVKTTTSFVLALSEDAFPSARCCCTLVVVLSRSLAGHKGVLRVALSRN